ncbi:hypothetical protein Pla108_12110 [Botrimarina colliarenosi]|uniref:DUF4148 domain-containing protein n=1 Tax=Botrimarina colliarenosi TaxID=2528001 RepID=A0A5C6APZ0_9BACT|nr:hypothetical protein [Botrimarina colliarenosi]TWU00264.1 hypothetical protein Pla108_12110 [Botrimarina colliarenosi]
MRIRLASLTLAAAALLMGDVAPAQVTLDPGPVGAPSVERPEYAGRIGKMTPMEIIQQKAQMKAAQRAGRIATREWYGYSQARPTTAATPFGGQYGAQFNGYTMGRPDSYYATGPVLVFAR